MNASGALHMDAVITPNASLTARGFKALLIVFVALNLMVGGVFLAIGALAVPVFLGLDVLGLYLAFRANYRAARRAERVRVSATEVTVAHESDGRSRTVWRSPTAFTRVAVEARGEHDARVRLLLSGRSVVIGRALSPEERVGFAEALKAAIDRARNERF